GNVADGTKIGVEIEGAAQPHIDRDVSASHRSRGRTFERRFVLANLFEHGRRKGRPVSLQSLGADLEALPFDRHAGGFDHFHGGFDDFRSDAIPGKKRDGVLRLSHETIVLSEYMNAAGRSTALSRPASAPRKRGRQLRAIPCATSNVRR